MTKYVATINVPGYMPIADPAVFDTAKGAWNYLADERRFEEDSVEDNSIEDSDTLETLRAYAEDGPSVIGTVYGPTPGYKGDHDLGMAYNVDTRHAD